MGPQSLSSIAHVQEIHENSEAVKSEFNQTNLSLTQSHNSSNDDFQHLFSSPLKFLAVLNENQHAGGGQREQQNIDFEATASDLGVVPFDVEDTYYNPLASSTPSVSQGPHILRKSNSLGIIQRRKRENQQFENWIPIWHTFQMNKHHLTSNLEPIYVLASLHASSVPKIQMREEDIFHETY